MEKRFCCICDSELAKDHIALNMKLINRQIENFRCLKCLAKYLDITEEDLLIKIKEFKERGCRLFIDDII